MSHSDTLEVRDNRTGTDYEIELDRGTIRARDLRRIKADSEDFGLMAYDPGFDNTAACTSAITELDGAAGILLISSGELTIKFAGAALGWTIEGSPALGAAEEEPTL